MSKRARGVRVHAGVRRDPQHACRSQLLPHVLGAAPVLPACAVSHCPSCPAHPSGRQERRGGWDRVAEAQVPCPCALVTGVLCSSQRHSLVQRGGLQARIPAGDRVQGLCRAGGKRRVGCKRQGRSPTVGSHSLGPEDPGNKGEITHQNSCPGPLQAQILHPLSCLALVGLC